MLSGLVTTINLVDKDPAILYYFAVHCLEIFVGVVNIVVASILQPQPFKIMPAVLTSLLAGRVGNESVNRA